MSKFSLNVEHETLMHHFIDRKDAETFKRKDHIMDY